MEIMPKVYSAVMEASSSEDKKYMKNMSKNDINQINAQSIQNLYDLTMKKSNVDFEDIPASAGDIEKCKYYKNTSQCLEVIDEMYKKNNITDDTLSVIKTAISNMITFRPQFTLGFRMKHDFIMLTYNSLVMAIIDASTVLIRSCINYATTADTEYRLVNNDKGRGSVVITSLRNFNQAASNGSLAQSLKYMTDAKIGSVKNNFVETNIIITGVIITCLLSIVPITKELIYLYYHSRVQLSDYLKMQSEFLEMNKLAVEASNRPPQERKQIVKKQEKVISNLRKMSDKLMIDKVDTEDVVKKKVKDESSIFSLTSIDKQLSKNKLENSDIMIL